MKTASVALVFALAAAGAASAVTLTDVRVGVHRDHTRIVLETDAKAPYIVDAGDREIIVHVDAAATAEAVTAKSPHLLWAKVEPTAIGADVRLSLKQPADVKAMVLTGPDRIVLDLYPRKGAASLPAPVLITEEEPEAATEARPQEPSAAVEREAAPVEPPALAENEGGAGAAVESPPEPEAEAPAESPELEAPAEPDESEGEPSELAGEAAAPPRAEAETTERAGRVEPVRPTTPLAPAPSHSPFGSPVLLAAVAALLLVVFLYLRRRQRSTERAQVPDWAPEEEAAFPPAREAVPVDAEPSEGESVFDVEPEALRDLGKEEDALPAPRRARPDAENETERRMAHLERRIEELVDARERLERQLAAQTEELRVQRAAIARTQRVLRSVTPRTDEDSSDPVKG